MYVQKRSKDFCQCSRCHRVIDPREIIYENNDPPSVLIGLFILCQSCADHLRVLHSEEFEPAHLHSIDRDEDEAEEEEKDEILGHEFEERDFEEHEPEDLVDDFDHSEDNNDSFDDGDFGGGGDGGEC